MVSFLDFLRPDTLLAMRDFLWLRERIQVVHDESLTAQAIAACEAEENGAISLEGKLIDGGEFTFRYEAHRNAGCDSCIQHRCTAYLP